MTLSCGLLYTFMLIIAINHDKHSFAEKFLYHHHHHLSPSPDLVDTVLTELLSLGFILLLHLFFHRYDGLGPGNGEE